MNPDLHLTVQDPTTLSLHQRLEVARLEAECFASAYPTDPPLQPDVLAEEMSLTSEDEECRLVLAHQDGQLIGRARLDYALTQNRDQTSLGVMVRPANRRRGVGRALAVRAGELALTLGRTSYIAATASRAPAGEAFAAWLGAHPALPMIISELRLDGLDQGLLSRWVTRPHPDSYALHRYAHIPEHELARVATVMQVMNTAPRGDLAYDDWEITPAMVRRWQEMLVASGERRLLYAVEHLESRTLVGYTEVFWHPARASLVYQGATGVDPAHRQRGLGQWLKAALLLDLPAANPEGVRVRTGNAESNAAMLGINRALGFQPVFRRMEWQGETAKLTAPGHPAPELQDSLAR
ncbi:GNAT family N-acetyltransferase [Deinococcus sonorensis]|uniref:GNAT family N-acetyltransferase n=2 Tax=Deinococcus sonorensis TaxID=309891 RepID=A0AAU7UAE1_9DEIO